MDSIKTGGSKMAPMSADQSERSNLLTIEAIGVCQTLVIEGSGTVDQRVIFLEAKRL